MEKRLMRWETIALAALCFTLLAAGWAQGEYTKLSGAVIRLHVIAASDDPAEQAIKLRVRDAVLEYLAPVLADGMDSAETRETIFADLNGIAAAAAGEAQGRAVTVTFGPENYPARRFEGGVLPAGRYESLRVVLDGGEGHNWWGLLFPQLCLPAAELSPEAERLQETLARDGLLLLPEQEGVELRFWILDFWGQLQQFFSSRACPEAEDGIY